LGSIAARFILLIQSLLRHTLVRLVLERRVVLIYTFFVDQPVELESTDDMPVLPPTELINLLEAYSCQSPDTLYALWAKAGPVPPASGGPGHFWYESANASLRAAGIQTTPLLVFHLRLSCFQYSDVEWTCQ